MNYPRGLGLDIISEFLNDVQMEELIDRYRNVPRKQRRIILPSGVCIRKVYLHALYKKVLSRKLKWKTIKKNFQMAFGTMELARTKRNVVRDCYNQRQKEIQREYPDV